MEKILEDWTMLIDDTPAWECFIFRRMNSTYLVPAPTITDAWEKLRIRQSCSIENCKKLYRHKGTMTKDSKIWKIK